MIIRNCRVVSPQGIAEAAVRFDSESGIILEVSPSAIAHPGEEEYDASGAFLLPGLIDIHCHLHHWSKCNFQGSRNLFYPRRHVKQLSGFLPVSSSWQKNQTELK